MVENKKNLTLILVIAIPVIATVISVTSVAWNYHISNMTFETQYRPYIGIERMNIEVTSGGMDCKVTIVNTGIVPANNFKMEYKLLLDGAEVGQETQITDPEEVSVLLMPLPTKRSFIFSVNKYLVDKKWVATFKFSYDGVKTKNHETYVELKHNPETHLFETTHGYIR